MKFHMNSRKARINHEKTRLETCRNSQKTQIVLLECSLSFPLILAPFSPHFHSILTPFWLHFGVILTPFCVFGGVLERRREKTPKFQDFGVPLGSPRAPFSTKNRCIFRSKNASLFSCIFNAFLAPFWRPLGSILHQKTSLGRKR